MRLVCQQPRTPHHKVPVERANHPCAHQKRPAADPTWLYNLVSAWDLQRKCHLKLNITRAMRKVIFFLLKCLALAETYLPKTKLKA